MSEKKDGELAGAHLEAGAKAVKGSDRIQQQRIAKEVSRSNSGTR
jgi:hypothetical protein